MSEPGRLKVFGMIFLKLVSPARGWEGVADLVAVLVGALSVFKLLHNAFQFSLTQIFGAVVEFYESTLDQVFAPLERLFHAIFETFGFHIALPPVWKHIFLLVAIYVFRHASNIAKQAYKEPDAGFRLALWATFILQVASGLFLCTLSAIALSALSGDDTSVLRQLGYVGFLVASVFIYDLIYISWHALVLLAGYNKKSPPGRTRKQFAAERVPDALVRNVAALGIGSAIVLALNPIGVPKPFIVGSLCALAVLGIAWSMKAADILHDKPELYQRVGVNIDSVQLSVSILKPMTWGIVAVLANAAFGAA